MARRVKTSAALAMGAMAVAAVGAARTPEPTSASTSTEHGDALYNRFCLQCHGVKGDGRGPARPYVWPSPRDFRAGAFHYKTTPAGRPASDADLARTIRQGVEGTSMQGFSVSLDADDLAALVQKIRRFSTGAKAADGGTKEHGPPSQPAPNLRENAADLPASAIAADKKEKGTRAGYWVANGARDESLLFGQAISLQGEAPSEFAPAQATQSALQCARCHGKQYREWGGTVHSSAGSAGLIAQLVAMEGKMHGASAESCQRCHAPLAEQHPLVRPAQGGSASSSKRYVPNPFFDGELREQGVNCATCHMRGWRRFGPPNPSQSLLRMPNYPVRAVDRLYTYLPIYERSDFCMPCHQLQPRLAVNGKPLLNTYKEWLEGPYMRRGIQCQHCHMPNREHTWKGIHDADTVRQGVRLDVLARRSKKSSAVNVRARLWNVGAGHYLPTTPTPAAWLTIELLDRDGEIIEGAKASKRIGRHIEYDGGWKEIEDTRIAPGDQIELARAWSGADAATRARIRLRVHPDDYYEGFYKRRLARKLPRRERRLFREALKQASSSHYIALDRIVEIAD